MPIAAGTRFGPYEIAAPLGAGGTGEVYRARDTRLGRDVALKVLPASVIGDAAARERFEREARLIASVQHPHICVLHDVGHADDTPYLVMELLAGETLDARLARGRLPLDDALAVAAQIAQALDAAHRHGIVHRDLKPANVMLQKATGASAAVDVKLLDFGVAKPVHRDMRSGDGMGTTGAMTAAGSLTDQHTLVGTLPYMAPEQLAGQPADARTDLWALGCVLYEMLTGTRRFKGETTVGLMAAILEHPPAPLPERAPLTPPLVDHLVSRCLKKDSERRWQTARDVALELDWARAHAAGPIAAPRPRKSTFPILGGVAAGAAVTAVLGLAAWPSRSAAPPDTLTGAMLAAEEGRIEIGHAEVKFTPDGRSLAVTVLANDSSSRIWLYSLDGSPSVPVAGTEGGRGPVFSRDGRWLAFTSGGKLLKVPAAGGTPIALASAGHMHGAAWSADDR